MTRVAAHVRPERIGGLALRRSTIWSLTLVLGALLASRAIVMAAALLADTIMVRNPALTSGTSSVLLRSLTAWDGWYYLGIARDGYHAAAVAGTYHDYAFLPLFPMLVRLLSAPFPDAAGLVAVVLANACFAAALVLLFALGRARLGDRCAAIACALLAISPFSAPFSMAYAESTFLALSVGAFLAAERRHRAMAGSLLALAALTRLPGALLAVPLLVLLLRQDGWKPKRSQAWVVLAPLAAAAFLAYVAWLTGSVDAYAANQADWGRGGLGSVAPGATIGASLAPILLTLLAILCATLFPLVYARVDRLPLEYVMIPILALGVVFASGNLESVGRYASVAFPLSWLIARRSVFWSRVWPMLSAGLLGVFALLSFGGYWVP
jgi:hypothetical protein